MRHSTVQTFKYWWLASRTPSVVKILFPIIVGLSAGFSHTGRVRPAYIALAMLFGWFNQLIIIFFNDAADYEADIHHTNAFPKLIDPRVLPNRWLSRTQIFFAGIIAASLMAMVTAIAWLGFQRPFAPLFFGASVTFLWAYSFPPIKLNYRGFGELLEMTGVGIILPLLGYYFYTGTFSLPMATIIPVALLSFAGSISSTLKHQPADAETGKRTLSVIYGPKIARVVLFTATVLGMLSTVGLMFTGDIHPAIPVITVVLPSFFVWRMAKTFHQATTEHLAALKAFKTALNNITYLVLAGLTIGLIWAR
ncbi:MAG: prenyltransferase [Deltaproteobacteria bacterium]|nr:prenyltransferase [Deltaproteobacteria bacterium]